MHRTLIAALAVFGAFACAPFTADQTVGRYKSATCNEDGNEVPCHTQIPGASASVTSIQTLAAAPTPSATSTPPADHALAACVAAINVDSPKKTASDFCAALAGKQAPPASTSPVDATVYHRTLIVTVRKEPPFNPADRLEATDVTIDAPTARFDNWDTIATAYTTISAGTVQLTQARGLTQSLTLGAPAPPAFPFSASGTFGGSQTDTRVENLTASQQAETLTATIGCQRHCLQIRRQGGYGVDLTGNTVIKVDMTLCDTNDESSDDCNEPDHQTVFAVDSYKKGDAWLSPDKISLTLKRYAVPHRNYAGGPYAGKEIARVGIPANVSLRYTIRHVDGGGSTYEEKDDDVSEITQSTHVAQTSLITGRETITPLYALHVLSGDDSGYMLMLEPDGGDRASACFASYEEASDFLAYLRIKSAKKPLTTIGRAKLTVGKHVPTLEDVAGFAIDTGC